MIVTAYFIEFTCTQIALPLDCKRYHILLTLIILVIPYLYGPVGYYFLIELDPQANCGKNGSANDEVESSWE